MGLCISKDFYVYLNDKQCCFKLNMNVYEKKAN